MSEPSPPNLPGSGPAPKLALRFISGKYQGGEFPLEDGRPVIVGRSSDLDMVLVEEMVSRKHARILLARGVLAIEDLGSTNGTFVNGEKIARAQLKEGDRVLIGTSILKVIAAGAPKRSDSTQNLEKVAVRRNTIRQRTGAEEAPRMTGALEEIPLPDLLQLFGTSRKNGVLVLRTDSRIGRIWLVNGVIHFAQIEGQQELTPLKAVFRMLGWLEGMFELDPPEQTSFPQPLDASVQEVLMEGFRQQDELANAIAKLGSPQQRLAPKQPPPAPLATLDPKLRELVKLASDSRNIQSLLDATPLLDLEAATLLVQLVTRGYLMRV
jgi:pSer/pThr/pTyr-binding forkhead associated (FHA) protein